MRQVLYIPVALFLLALPAMGQVVTADPVFPTAGDAVTITFNAALGTGTLKGYTGEVYAHTGVITDKSTSGSDWKYVKTAWGENTPETKLTRISTDLYELHISPSIREYYGVPVSEKITRLALVFRSSDSNLEGKDDNGADIFVEVFEEGFRVSILTPEKSLVITPGSAVDIRADASSVAQMILYINGVEVTSATASSITHIFRPEFPGDYRILVTASKETELSSDSIFVHALEEEVTGPLPAGLYPGINDTDDSTVHLVLYAPGKEHVFVIGEFNNWEPRSGFRMKVDGDHFWTEVSGLAPGQEYAFQYLVNGTVAVADPYTEKVLDPVHDRWISDATYPGLKPYPEEPSTGITSIMQTGREEYSWTNDPFDRPSSENLIIYELLLRDFLEAHDWKTLTDTLGYFSRLGVNAIELMPVNEFEGNESWGYNPSFYFAPDKYYGPSEDLKVFIDSCHGRGIAIIMDLVLNHSFSQSPLVQLYFDRSSGRVTSDNPWYNVTSPNPVYAWGYDFDHESQAARDFIDRVNRYWIEEYHVDGFRFDFTKGFTNTPGDGSAYDPARIAILKRIADVIRSYDSEAYLILEHFAPNNEEMELAAYGFLLWGNMNYHYNEATMGYHENGKSDFNGISYLDRGWNEPGLVGYMESHDEERLMFKNLEFGNAAGSYRVSDLSTALSRMELAGAFFFTIPGPKMIWQFGELGYDFSIDYNCRVCNKPIRWDYLQVEERKRLYAVWSALVSLKTLHAAFSTDDYSLYLSGPVKRIKLHHPEMDVRIIGNFDVVPAETQPDFGEAGWWYDYFSGDSVLVETGTDGLIREDDYRIFLEPGRFHVFTSQRLDPPGVSTSVPGFFMKTQDFRIYPNPVSGVMHFERIHAVSVMTITGMDGRTVMEAVIPRRHETLDLTGLPDGLYMISRRSVGTPPRHAKILKISR